MAVGMGEGRDEAASAVGHHGLERWIAAQGRPRQVVCLGDSITVGVVDESTGEQAQSWVDLVALDLGSPGDRAPTDGFRGMWRGREWARRGSWRQTTRADEFDAAPFEYGFVSPGDSVAEATWTKPAGSSVESFDLYSLAAPGPGDLQYRVDDGPWQNVGSSPGGSGGPTGSVLTRLVVDQPVDHLVEVRGFDGSEPCVVALAGIDVHAPAPSDRPRDRLHHLGLGMQMLGSFCRETAGDPMALLDELRPELIIVAFSNDVLWGAPTIYEATLRRLLERVEPYADVLVISPFEQRPPRRVHDLVTTAGSRRVRSETASFVASDVTVVVEGTGIPVDPATAITAVVSTCEAELSAPATVDGSAGELTIGAGREVEVQAAYRAANRRVAAAVGCAHLDLYELWSDAGATGWDAATAQGLMVDRYHASPRGHQDIAGRVLRLLEGDDTGAAVTGDADRAGGGVVAGVPEPTAELPEVVPGTASVPAPTSGTVDLHVPVGLSSASSETVTVRWRTRLVETDLVQAPPSDYVAAAGTVAFAPGQTSATVALTVTGNSTGADECIVVSFTDPTNAVMAGTSWGVGFGVITPSTPSTPSR
ncbi:MAG: hypothetical protein ACXWCB_06135 [Acidimicrobiales bacterium]